LHVTAGKRYRPPEAIIFFRRISGSSSCVHPRETSSPLIARLRDASVISLLHLVSIIVLPPAPPCWLHSWHARRVDVSLLDEVFPALVVASSDSDARPPSPARRRRAKNRGKLIVVIYFLHHSETCLFLFGHANTRLFIPFTYSSSRGSD
jgi:hypothetical protein